MSHPSTGADGPHDAALVADDRSSLARVGAGIVGAGVVAVLLGVVMLAGAVDLATAVAGVSVAALAGLALALAGAGLLVAGGLSRADVLESSPDRTAGLPAATALALFGLAAGGLVASQTLGLATLWPLGALAVGVGAGAATLLPREDLGVTLPAGSLSLSAGLLVLGGVFGGGWTWRPVESSVTVTGEVAVGVLAASVGLLVVWTGGRVAAGLGTRGRQRGAYLLVGANAAAMVALLLALVTFVLARGWAPMTRGVKLGLFWEPVYWFWFPPIREYVVLNVPGIWFYWPFAMEGYALTNDINGVAPAIIGTVWLVVGAVAFAVPLGVGAAVFLTEYAEQGRFTRLVEISTNGLWSTPSIVYGLFGLAFLVPRLGNTTSLLSGMIVLGFMLLPLVVITSREAIKSVPDEYRDASAALGVSRWETVKSVVLPAAMPGVITGVILGVGRIAGETAPILLVAVNEPFPRAGSDLIGSFRFTPSFPFVDIVNSAALTQPTSALPYQLFAVITAGVGENLAFGWATALVLLLVVLSFYGVGIATRVYFRRKLQT